MKNGRVGENWRGDEMRGEEEDVRDLQGLVRTRYPKSYNNTLIAELI